MAFHDVRLPVNFAFGITGGPERKTEVAMLGPGAEERNAVWANSRRRYNAGYAIDNIDEFHPILEFFEARNGRLHSFRIKDHRDFKSCAPQTILSPLDQVLGSGNGSETDFQLIKVYGDDVATWTRNITKPVEDTVRVAVAGVELTTGWTVDLLTGIVTFLSGSTPDSGQEVTAGFEFDVPVRFDTDQLNIDLASWEKGIMPDIPLIEVPE